MKFFRENIFLVALVGAVVLVGGGMLGLGFSVSGGNDDLVEQRMKLSGDLARLDSPNVKANDGILQATRDHRDRVKAAAQTVIKTDNKWNRQRYKVMAVKYLAEGNTKVANIFPMDRDLYEEYPIISRIPKLYHKELDKLVQSLSPAELPTDAEIAQEQTRFQRWLDLQAQTGDEPGNAPAVPVRVPNLRGRGPTRRGRTSGRGEPEMFGRDEMEMTRGRGSGSGRLTRTRSGAAGVDAAAEAQEMGWQYARMKKARTGKIYADISAFDIVMQSNAYNPSDKEIWAAQLNLWVTQDIVTAIRNTNDAILRQFDDPNQRNVVNAPVKRLANIDVSEEYYTGGEVAMAAKGSSRQSSGRGSGRMDSDDLMTGMGGRGRGGSGRGGSGRGAAPAAVAVGEPQTLTNRVCNSEYDVVHYNFSVVMPTRYLPELQRQLLDLNHHTIIGMAITEAGTSDSARSSGRGGRSSAASELRYYGTDPVLEVTLYGELLLLTSWERGTVDDDKEEWVLPPLMPDEVLASIHGRTEDAMREEDQTRLEEAGFSVD